jgi:alkylation response protein AidB-like acyl-CoA dehydrogenase
VRLEGTAEQQTVKFGLSQEQTILRDTVEKFVQDRYGSNQRRQYRAAPGGYSAENWRDLANLGLLGLPFSEADGGLAATPRDLLAVMEAIGSGFVVEPVLEELVLAAGFLARAGSEEQKRDLLPGIIAGQTHLALAHFEHGARFNLADVRLQVRSEGGCDRLVGEKMVVPLAACADHWIVSARRSGAPADPAGIEFHLVSPTAAGLERRDFRLIDGSVASAIGFRGTPATQRLPGGFEEFAAVADTVRIAAGAEMIGIMSTLFQSTIDYLRARRQFGVPLSSFQALQHRLADLYVLLEQSRSQVLRAALAAAPGARRAANVAGMKSYVSRAAIEIGQECVHLHGGIGTSDDLALGHGYKRLLLLASLFGDADSELTRFMRLDGSPARGPGAEDIVGDHRVGGDTSE